MSLNALKRLTKRELSNMTLEYQNKFDNMLLNINNFRTYSSELTSLMEGFTKMGSQLLVTSRMNNNLLKQNHILERK